MSVFQIFSVVFECYLGLPNILTMDSFHKSTYLYSFLDIKLNY